jgi:hypothetical protein
MVPSRPPAVRPRVQLGVELGAPEGAHSPLRERDDDALLAGEQLGERRVQLFRRGKLVRRADA